MGTIWMTWGQVFNTSLQSLWFSLVQFLPNLVLAIVFFIIGWVLGSLIAKAIEQVFGSLKIDRLFASIGAERFFHRAGMNLNTGYFIGQVVRWFVIIVFLLPSLSLVHLDSIGDYLKGNVLDLLPRIIIAAFILIIATVISDGISSAIKASAKSMNLTSANLLATVAKYTVWVFAFIVALGQLGIAPYYMSVIFTGIIAMVSIGGALAFGLGGRDAASRLIAKLEEEVSHRQ